MLDTESAFLKTILRTIPDMVWLQDPDGAILACNSAAAYFFGRPESEVMGKSDFDFLLPEEPELHQARDRQAAAGQAPLTHHEWVTIRGSGRRVLIETVKTPMRNSAGALIGVLEIARDITATTAPGPLESIADTLPGVIFSYRLGPDGTSCLPYASAALEELWGFRPEELAADATAARDSMHPDDMPRIRALLEAAARSLSPCRGEFRVRHRRKGEVWLEGCCTPVREANGSILFHGYLADVTDRKHMEEALRLSEARLNEAQRLAGTGSWVWDVETDTITCSETLHRLSGRDPASPPVPGAELHRLYTQESCDRLRVAVEATLKDGTPHELDLEVVLPDGKSRWRTTHAEAERDENGRIVRLRGTSQDTTERKLAEEELRAAHAELAVIHSHTPVVMLVVDEDLRIEKGNETAARLAGRTESQMVGLRPGSSIGCLNSLASPKGCVYGPACGNCAIRLALLDTIQNGIRHDEIEAWVPLTTGRQAELRCMLVFTAPMEIHGKRKALLSILDITDRKKAERELQVSEARFRTLTEDAPIAISAARDGQVFYGNPMYLKMFGFERAEKLYGCPTIELFAPQSRDHVKEIRQRRVQGLPVPREYEAVGRRADGSEFPMLVAVIAMQFAEGEALVAFITDLTATRQAEEERSQLEQQFRQAQKLESIGRLAGGVAHDFNNLLMIINGYSQLLLNQLHPHDPMRDSLEEISSAGERAAELTHQLLAFSRKQVLKPRVMDLNRVVSETLPMLERLLGEDIELCVELHAETPTICADLHQLEHVVMNLAVNSRDAMPCGGKLLIETAAVEWSENHARSHPGARAGCYVMLAVTDNGEGMSEETRRQIFEPFFTTKEVGKGTGLGLSMVQGIVAQSGGHIEVQSEPGHGTTFRIFLPKMENLPAESCNPKNAPANAGKATVLVIEDQAEVRKYIAAALKSYGYRVIEAANAGEALLLCERAAENIDLALTDVVMPHLSGGELSRRLGQRWPGIKVLFMSGYTDDTIVRHGVLERDVEFMQKPFSPDQLASKVQEMLKTPENAAQLTR